MKKTVFAGSMLFFSLLCFTVAAFAAPMEVFVSISPQKWVSDHVGGSLVVTHVLVGKGQDPHTYEPTPKQIAALSRAKMYFTLDLEFEEQIVPRLEKTVPTLHMIDTADAIPKIAMTAHEHDEPGHGESGHDEHAHAKDKHHHEEGMDPHVWLSPLNLKIMAAEMAKAMIAHDSANKSSYEKNLEDVNQILDRVHQQITQELAPYHGASFYVFHPAFGYFAQAYHLQQQAIETGGKSPSPKQLSALINQAKANKARIIFVQPQFDPKSAQAIADGIAGEVVPLDPLAEDVVSNLEIMAGKIKTALSVQ
jgi:zinc transport system substrate-binding protein